MTTNTAGFDQLIFDAWVSAATSDGGEHDPLNQFNFLEAIENYNFRDVIDAYKQKDVALAGHLLYAFVLRESIRAATLSARLDRVGYIDTGAL